MSTDWMPSTRPGAVGNGETLDRPIAIRRAGVANPGKNDSTFGRINPRSGNVARQG